MYGSKKRGGGIQSQGTDASQGALRGGCRDTSAAWMAGVAVFFGLIWLGLWARAYWVQVHDGPKLAEQARQQQVASESVAGERGQILDRNGRLLAKSVEFKSVAARPFQVTDPGHAAAVLSKALGRRQDQLLVRLKAGKPFVWIARQVSDRAALDIQAAGLKGVEITSEYGRQYPNKHLAGQLLGFVNVDGKGLEGLEKSFEQHLAGKDTRFLVERDAAGRKLYFDAQGREVDIRGKDIRLTLDANIQFVAEEALARAVTDHRGRWGGCLVVDLEGGEILAWAQYPFFNPNASRHATPSQWRNRIVQDALEPGSTAKPLLVAAAVQENVCQPDTVYNCENGRWKVGGIRIKDTHEYGLLTVSKVIRYSSNICAAKIGLALGASKYYDYLERLGFGQRTGVPVPGENVGILRRAGQWQQADLAATSFGQSFSASMLQMAQAYQVLASDGVKRPLKLVLDPAPSVSEDRIFKTQVARAVLSMLRDVVQEDGTGTEARIDGLDIGGKTGTAQKAETGVGYGAEYAASFVGLLPTTKPRYMVYVLVDEPDDSHYGGVVAAPAFKEITSRMLAYRGELPGRGPAVAAGEGKGEAHDGTDQKVAGTGPGSEVEAAGPADDGNVPNVVGLPVRRAVELFALRGVVPLLKGEGLVVSSQQPAAGTPWPQNRQPACVLWLGAESS